MKTVNINRPKFIPVDPNNRVRYSTAQGLINEQEPPQEMPIQNVASQRFPEPSNEIQNASSLPFSLESAGAITPQEAQEVEMNPMMKKAIQGRHEKTINLKITIDHGSPGEHGSVIVDGNTPKPTPDEYGTDKFLHNALPNDGSSGLAPEVLDKDAAMEGEAPSTDPMEEHKEMMDVMDGVQTTLPGKKPNLNQRAKELLLKKKHGK